jgi:hypothetical protein
MFSPPALSSSTLGPAGTWSNAGPYAVAVDAWAAKYASPFSASSTDYAPEVFSRTRAKLGLDPFAFLVTGAVRKQDQHFLRSRLTSP